MGVWWLRLAGPSALQWRVAQRPRSLGKCDARLPEASSLLYKTPTIGGRLSARKPRSFAHFSEQI